MYGLTEKVAYLQGLAEGLDIKEDSKEGKLMLAIIDVLDDLALDVEDLTDQIDAIDLDLSDLEEYVYEEDEDFCEGDCEGCEGCDGYGDFEEEALYEFECPACHEIVYFDEELFDGEDDAIECPNCGTVLELDAMAEEDDED